MMREKNLIKNTIIVAIGQMCTKFMSFFLLPLYTSYLSSNEFGIVDILNTYISLLIPIFFFQIEQGVFRFLIDARNNDNIKKKIISSSIFVILIQTILYLLLFLLFSRFINNDYKYFLLLNVFLTMFSTYMLQVCRGLGDNLTYSISSIVIGTISLVLNIIFIVVFKFGAKGMLLAMSLSNLFGIIFVFLRLKLYQFIRISYFDNNEIKQLWRYSLPLVPNQLSWWIVNASDRSIISLCLGVSVNGIYAVANKISSLIIATFSIFSLTWTESASLAIEDKDNSKYFSKIFNESLKLFVSLCIFLIIILPFAFKLLITGSDFADAYFQIPILLIATVFNIIVSLLGSVYVSLKKSKEIAKTSIYAALINFLINIMFIKYIGLYAASISTLIAYISMSIYRFINVQKYIKIKFNNSNFILLLILIYSFLSYYLNNLFINIFNLLIVFILLYINKEFYYFVHNLFKNKMKFSRTRGDDNE